MIDLHCHILPGLDDGAPDWDASLAMARQAVADGVRTVAATPHVNFRYEFELEQIPARAEQLNTLLGAEGLALEVVPGAEVATTWLLERGGDDLSRLALGDGSSILVESPYLDVAGPLEELVFDLQLEGLTPVLAHPERCPAFHADTELLERLVAAGALTSLSAGSLAGSFGSTVRRFATTLLRRGLVHDVSSDAHDSSRRPLVLSGGLKRAVRDVPEIADQVGWLTRDASAAILSGQPLPERPAVASRPWWRRFLG